MVSKKAKYKSINIKYKTIYSTYVLRNKKNTVKCQRWPYFGLSLFECVFLHVHVCVYMCDADTLRVQKRASHNLKLE